MIKKIFKPITIGGASAIISIASFFSYGMGLIRDKIIAYHFATSQATDAYNASFLIPDSIFNIFIASALTAAFMPVFAQSLATDKAEARSLANTVLTAANMLIILISAICFIFMEQITNLAYPDMSADMKEQIVTMTRIILPSAIVFTISNTLGNILMSYKHFIAYSFSPIFYNGGIILGITLFSDEIGIYSAAAGVIVGAIFHCAIRVVDIMFTEYKYKPELNFQLKGFKKIIKLMIPKALGLACWPINLYLISTVSVALVEGGFAAFNYARNIQSFAVSLFGIAFATAVFPSLTESIGSKRYDDFTEHIRKTLQRILFFTIPAMAGVMILSTEITELILGGGEFGSQSVALTSIILLYFGLSIPFESTMHILTRGFYAVQNTITPTITNFVAMIVTGLITVFVAAEYGVQWLSIAFSAGLIAQNILLLLLLKKHFQDFKFREFLSSMTKIIIATIFMIGLIIVTKDLESIINPKLSHLFRILIGGGGFILAAIILKSPEVSSIKYIIDRLFKKHLHEKAK